MKYITLILIALLCALSSNLNALGVGIGTTTPDQSAALDIVDTNKGVLLPRLTTTQRTTMANPVHSLLVFDTTTNSFWWRDGSKWVELASLSNGLNDSDRDTGVYVEQTPDEDEVTISLAGQERARFFGDQLYLKDKLSLGTYSKRAMLTMRGPDDPAFGPSVFMYGNGSDQFESGRLRFVEGTFSNNWRGGFIHYDGTGNRLNIGTHNLSDNNPNSDFNAMTIKRINGFVGVNDINPQHRLSVEGSLKVEEGTIMIETTQQEITLQAGQSTITIAANGNVLINCPSGNISMNAENIDITATENLSLTAGKTITQTANDDINFVAGADMTTTVGKAIEVIAGTNIAISSTLGMNIASGLEMDINSTSNLNLNGPLLILNGSTSSPSASRQGDDVQVTVNGALGTGTITSGSSTVLIGG